jgi:hypothetical protein
MRDSYKPYLSLSHIFIVSLSNVKPCALCIMIAHVMVSGICVQLPYVTARMGMRICEWILSVPWWANVILEAENNIVKWMWWFATCIVHNSCNKTKGSID